MTDALRDKLKTLPNEPGVYFHRDAERKIIYIGKAAVLKNRVRSYFQNGPKDPKTNLLVADIADTDWITVGSEVEALFLESEMIKRYMPKYNIDLRDDKHWNYVKITTKADFPVISYVRRPLDDDATYFGPFTSGDAMKRAMKYLRRVFPYVTHHPLPTRACLQAHLGLCPNPEEGAIGSAEYKRRIRQIMRYLRGDKDKLLIEFERAMARASKRRDYEGAARARDQLRDLESLSKQMIFGDTEMFDLTRDQALVGLAERLELTGIPRRIECYDISHLGGVDNVASMVVFTDGVANRDSYRRFKMRAGGNDDVGHMREVLTRRFSEKNLQDWLKPDLIVVDGGKGQLGAALKVLEETGVKVPAVGLAKRLDEIIRVGADGQWEAILLPESSHVLQLLQRLRDEAHRSAITYQSILRGKRQVKSQLDEIPGVGPATRKRLIKQFGSVRGLAQASEEEVAGAVGPSKAAVIKEHLK